MKYLYIIITALICNSGFAQTIWSPQGAEWHYDYHSQNSTGYTKIKYTGDTIINSKQCKVLEKTKYLYLYDTEQYDTVYLGKEYTYSENNKVYYFRFGTFYCLYDFNMINNNTWQIAGTEPTSDYSGLCDSTAVIQTDSSDIFSYNSFNLTRLYVSYNDTAKWLMFGEIIERIGASSYMFPLNNCVIDAENEGGQLRCYYDNEFGSINFNTSGCDYILSVNNANNIEKSDYIFPSAVTSSNFVNINSYKTIGILQITDLQGRLISEKQFYGNSGVLNTGFLKNGIYIIHYNNKSHKIVINR